MIEKIKAIPIYKLIIDIVCIVIALFGVIVSIKMNFVGRSLWFDEAALAYSFVQRGFSDLTATGLDLVQSAPVGWLYVLKIICAIFGYTDFVMRVPSILAYLGMLCLTYYISHKIIKIYYAFAPVAFAASLPLLLQYSNVFKPYISDAFFALLILCLFYWYKEKKLNIFVLAVIWGVILWFSSTACFVEGGVIIASFIVTLINRDKKTIKKDIINLVIIGVIIVVFFGIYYIYWLGKVDDGMHGFWADWSFKFIPLSMDDLRHMKKMISTLFDPFYYFKAVTFILFIVGFIVSIIKKNQYILSV
nr:glycosyltransferase family 39 protein [Lachnospiraceae bacterium]